MPRKPATKEEELDLKVNEPQKKETFVTRWFKDNCPDNQDDIRKVCELTARSAEEQFCMFINSMNPEVFAVTYFGTFLTILDFLKERQKRFPKYTIEIANSVNIGYKNNTDDKNEKVGNFMPVMEYIGVNRVYNMDDNPDVNPNATTEAFMSWKQLNIKKTIEYYKEIQESAYNRILNDYFLDLRSSEAIIPLFCIFMDHVNNVLRMKYREADGTKVSEISMNVLGLFNAFYSYDEEAAKECIEYEPSPLFKLSLKNDVIAGM